MSKIDYRVSFAANGMDTQTIQGTTTPDNFHLDVTHEFSALHRAAVKEWGYRQGRTSALNPHQTRRSPRDRIHPPHPLQYRIRHSPNTRPARPQRHSPRRISPEEPPDG